METIRLTDIEGTARLTGLQNANSPNEVVWTQFTVDTFAEQTLGQCSICGAELWEGWLCLDGGEEVCSDHVEY